MVRLTSRCTAILALLVLGPSLWVQVQADDVEVTDGAPSPADSAPSPAEGGEAKEGEGQTDEEKGQAFADSAKELSEKLGQLRALLDAKGESADPGLKEKLAGLEKQIEGLGLSIEKTDPSEDPATMNLLMACIDMSCRRVGMKKPSTIAALHGLAKEEWTPEQALKQELWKLAATCVTELEEAELEAAKLQKLLLLPKRIVDLSKKPEADAKIAETVTETLWSGMRQIAEIRHGELTDSGGGVPHVGVAALLGIIPAGLMIAFVGKLYLDSEKAKQEKEDRKKNKKANSGKSK